MFVLLIPTNKSLLESIGKMIVSILNMQTAHSPVLLRKISSTTGLLELSLNVLLAGSLFMFTFILESLHFHICTFKPLTRMELTFVHGVL